MIVKLLKDMKIDGVDRAKGEFIRTSHLKSEMVQIKLNKKERKLKQKKLKQKDKKDKEKDDSII